LTLRILSIDGGGIRGIVAARMLEFIQQWLDQPIADYFDLIAGTSTGAILAAGIAIGMSPSELYQLYLNKGQIIFPYRSWFNPQRISLVFKYGLSAPKFSDDGLIQVLQEEIGLDKTVADITSQGMPSNRKLMITSYDTVQRLPVLFKSWHPREWYASVPLWEACVCSASAPTYFPAHPLQIKHDQTIITHSMIDGGAGANNPTAWAVAEAIQLLRAKQPTKGTTPLSLDQIVNEVSVLSLGTGALLQSLPWKEVRGWGLIEWAPRIVDVVMDAPNDIYEYISREIVTKAGTERTQHYLRLQPELDQKFGAIDNATSAYLKQLTAITDAYLKTQVRAIGAFFNH
jgi:uncharacterized protein